MLILEDQSHRFYLPVDHIIEFGAYKTFDDKKGEFGAIFVAGKRRVYRINFVEDDGYHAALMEIATLNKALAEGKDHRIFCESVVVE